MVQRGSNRRPVTRVRKNFINRYLSRKKVLPLAFIGTLILFACTLVWQQVYMLDLSSEVRVLEKKNDKLTDLVKKRKAEIVELSRLSVVEGKTFGKKPLRRTRSENLFTLVRDESYRETDGFDKLVGALKKVADNMPVINETHAESKDIFDFDKK